MLIFRLSVSILCSFTIQLTRMIDAGYFFPLFPRLLETIVSPVNQNEKYCQYMIGNKIIQNNEFQLK